MTTNIIHTFKDGNLRGMFSRDDLELHFYSEQEERIATLHELELQCDLMGSSSKAHEVRSEICDTTLLPINETDQHPRLGRLTLVVSNACNLNCVYCYASGGSYYNAPGLLMNQDTVFNALNYAAHRFSRVEHINYFGGEPTLNADVIEIACAYVHYLHEKQCLSHLPSFGITTNAYKLSDRMVEILARYGFSVEISIDGPKLLHDRQRPTRSGNGSYEAIRANAMRLQERGINVFFESTYTRRHLEMGISIPLLMDFMSDEFHCSILHCPIVIADPDSDLFIPLSQCLRLQADGMEYSIENFFRGFCKMTSLAARMLGTMVNKEPVRNYCPAARSELTINADGDIYPCFMLMQSDAWKFDNVNRSANEPRPLERAASERDNIEGHLRDADKNTNPACRQCWARPLCFGCLGEDFARCNWPKDRSHMPGISEFCDYKRGLVETFLRLVGRSLVRLQFKEKDYV